MISNDRKDYASASEWLAALREDEAWGMVREELAKKNADLNTHFADALKRIGDGTTFEYWVIYKHEVEKVVTEVWALAELSLVKLKLQTIGMLAIEWIEQRKGKFSEELVAELSPIFFGQKKDAIDFLVSIKGMEDKQITERVNQLVREHKISDMSRKRPLWTVLNKHGLYSKSESNWNSQVR